ncbi:MAG: hypothetical protein ACK5Q5_18585 [Planctomycetaceae bacterium]
MVGFNYLSAGMAALARAHRAGTMAGHLGAAVVAGYFFGEDQSELPEPVYRGIERELDRIRQGEEKIWFNARQAGVTPAELFEPLPIEDSTPQRAGEVVAALAANCAQTRQSGHNVIFAAIGLRALQDHPAFATPIVIDGLIRMTQGFNTTHAGRGYYGKPSGWKNGNEVHLPSEDESFPPYAGIPHMVTATVNELIGTASARKQGFGGLWHLINHAAAIVELDGLGYGEVARLALQGHHQHLRLWRTLPNVEGELGGVDKAAIDPRESDYWAGRLKRDEARLTHRIKTLYGFNLLRPFIADEVRLRRAEDAFLYLLA